MLTSEEVAARRAAEAEREARQRATLERLARELPEQLPPPSWTVISRPEIRRGFLTFTRAGDGAMFTVEHAYHDRLERLEIQSCLPERHNLDLDGRVQATGIATITVAATRATPEIAREIVRRLLPELSERVQVNDRARAAALAERAKVKAVQDSLTLRLAPLGGKLRLDAHRGVHWWGEEGTIELTVSSDDVDVTLRRLPAELAREVLDVFVRHVRHVQGGTP